MCVPVSERGKNRSIRLDGDASSSSVNLPNRIIFCGHVSSISLKEIKACSSGSMISLVCETFLISESKGVWGFYPFFSPNHQGQCAFGIFFHLSTGIRARSRQCIIWEQVRNIDPELVKQRKGREALGNEVNARPSFNKPEYERSD